MFFFSYMYKNQRRQREKIFIKKNFFSSFQKIFTELKSLSFLLHYGLNCLEENLLLNSTK